MPPLLHTSDRASGASTAASIPSLHMQRASRPLGLHTSMLPHLHGLQRTSSGSYLHTSTSLRLQRGSRTAKIRAPSSTPTRLNASPALHNCMPLRRYACSAPPDLQTSIPPCFHVCTLRARLWGSLPASEGRLQRASRPPYFHTSIPPRHSLHVQCASQNSRAPYLVAATTSSLQNSMPPQSAFRAPKHPHRYASIELSNVHTSPSLRLQRTSRAPFLHTSTSACLQSTSRDPYLYGCTPAALLRSSIPSRRYTFI